jgi:hypothetical protein
MVVTHQLFLMGKIQVPQLKIKNITRRASKAAVTVTITNGAVARVSQQCLLSNSQHKAAFIDLVSKQF